jgi:hypothetical protein
MLQQKTSRLETTITTETGLVGKAAVAANQVDPVEAQEVTSSKQDTPILGATYHKRWYVPKSEDWGDLVDSFDKIRSGVEIGGPLLESARMALRRFKDKAILNGFYGVNRVGENGDQTVTFKPGNIIADASTGLTLAKLMTIRERLINSDFEPGEDKITVVVSGRESSALLDDIKYTSSDFGHPVLDNGKLKSFMGFDFVEMSEKRFQYANADTLRQIPVYTKKALALGIWADIEGWIEKRVDKKGNPQIYAKGTWGATRLDEEQCFIINCKV